MTKAASKTIAEATAEEQAALKQEQAAKELIKKAELNEEKIKKSAKGEDLSEQLERAEQEKRDAIKKEVAAALAVQSAVHKKEMAQLKERYAEQKIASEKAQASLEAAQKAANLEARTTQEIARTAAETAIKVARSLKKVEEAEHVQALMQKAIADALELQKNSQQARIATEARI